MNPPQKAVLIITLAVLPLTVLFMYGMNYRSAGVVGLIGAAGAAALLYFLRTPRAERGKP